MSSIVNTRLREGKDCLVQAMRSDSSEKREKHEKSPIKGQEVIGEHGKVRSGAGRGHRTQSGDGTCEKDPRL